ncbi:MAG TPA: serine/threonine-protein kinase [Kofleriaceae bacterium]|jgi:serine/threonine-protein kinase
MASGTGGRHTPEAIGDTAVAGNTTAAATRATDAMTPLDKDELAKPDIIGTTLSGRYLITRKVGQGGMGAVYEATHTLIGKRVAVKVLLEKYANREAIVQRLEQEARLASSVGNEHIIDITDFGQTEDGRRFVVMEFLEGESLAECLQRETKLPEQRIIWIAAQAASALAAAHEKGVVHRDIKPENLFLQKRKDRDFVKVVDFGISKSLRVSEDDDQPRLTQTGMVLGTPLYMSPEQARGDEELDARVDIYALGVILYEAAAGRVPFSGTNYLSVISQVLNEEPPPLRDLRPELTEEFEAIVGRAMAKNRADRYASATDLLTDLQALQDDPTHSTERAKITGPRKKTGKKARGGLRIGAWIAVVAVIIAAVVVTATMLLGGEDKKKQKTQLPVAVLPDAPPPPDAAPPPPPPEAKTREITIVTEPTGAQILEDGSKDRGNSPSTFRMVVHDRPSSFTATLDGYEDSTISVNPLVDGLDGPVKIKLKKLKKGAPPPPRHVPATGSGSAAPEDKTHGEIDKPNFGNLVPKTPK